MTERAFDKKCKDATVIAEKHLGFEFFLNSLKYQVIIWSDNINKGTWACSMEPDRIAYNYNKRYLRSTNITEKTTRREMADDIVQSIYGFLYGEYRATTIRRLYNKSGTIGFQIFKGNKIYYIDCESKIFKSASNKSGVDLKKKLTSISADSYETESVEKYVKQYVKLENILVKDTETLLSLVKWLEE